MNGLKDYMGMIRAAYRQGRRGTIPQTGTIETIQYFNGTAICISNYMIVIATAVPHSGFVKRYVSVPAPGTGVQP